MGFLLNYTVFYNLQSLNLINLKMAILIILNVDLRYSLYTILLEFSVLVVEFSTRGQRQLFISVYYTVWKSLLHYILACHVRALN